MSVNRDGRWRLDVARAAAAVYASNPKIAAVAAAGSVGAGLADEWSDLEIDLYWHRAPDDDDRRRPIELLGGELETYWPYSAEEEEWGEEYRIGQLKVGISGFLVESAERFLDLVTNEGDPNTNAQMRVAAIQCSVPLAGEALLEQWKARCRVYPDDLRRRMVLRYLHPDRLAGWHLCDALVHRNDRLAVHDLLVAGQRSVLGTLHGLNRVFVANPRMKWEQSFLTSLEVAPAGIVERSARLWEGDLSSRVQTGAQLLVDVAELAAEHTRVDVSPVLEVLGARRPRIAAP